MTEGRWKLEAQMKKRYFLAARSASGIRFRNQSGECLEIRMDRASSGR
jgi:hypothetical protein